jgi:glyoxylase-like metal-dependent hydrolase (beta-lactamase superfamily II)
MDTSIQEVAEKIYEFQVPILSGVACTGDHIVQRIPPNISIQSDQHPLNLPGRYNPLHDYLASLAKTRALDFTLGWPSHGPLLTDPRGCMTSCWHTTRPACRLCSTS